MVRVRSKPFPTALPGLTPAGASPLIPAPALAGVRAVDWLSRVSRLRRASTHEVPRIDARILDVDARGEAHRRARGRPAATTTVPAARTALLGAVTVGDAVEVPAARHAGMVRVVGTRPRR
ncbi:hypothetical protein H0176_21205 [Methylorubrum populi]|uniref:hypothetical protein n=1 Tax=Methylorubrum rhodesianum TaxID=29427 RepID=UPI00190BA60C|nr:hypothetical protein [Methylorubrum rhodesianum]MBK3403975.1 hypothetical protein [Methylorubrum rhodesianum]MBY0142768.1 hypothetical protein [Methylorubrum populi]